MGTSGAYGGSGGRAWSNARKKAEEYADLPTNENAAELLSDIADAIEWDADNPERQYEPVPLAPSPRFPSRDGGDGPAGGGGGGTVGSSGGGRQRSRSRAAAVGGSVATAGLAVRAGDDETLRQFGLRLADLADLEPHEQARTILDAVAGSLGAIQEDELQHAAGVAVLALLDENATADDAVRAFIADYVFEISITEVGNELRNGTRDGYTTVDQEDQLRNLIEACVNQLELPVQLDATNIQEAIYSALDDSRTFLSASQ